MGVALVDNLVALKVVVTRPTQNPQERFFIPSAHTELGRVKAASVWASGKCLAVVVYEALARVKVVCVAYWASLVRQDDGRLSRRRIIRVG